MLQKSAYRATSRIECLQPFLQAKAKLRKMQEPLGPGGLPQGQILKIPAINIHPFVDWRSTIKKRGEISSLDNNSCCPECHLLFT